LFAAHSAVCSCHDDQAVRGLQVLGSAAIGQLLVTGLDACNAAAAAPPHNVHNLQAVPAGSSATRALHKWVVVDCGAFSCVGPLEMLQVLCGLPAAQELPAAAVQQLLLALAALMRQQNSLLAASVELHKSCDRDDQLGDSTDKTLTKAFTRSFQNMHAWGKLVQQLLALPAAEQVLLQLQQCQDQPLKDCITEAQVRTAAVLASSGCL
jgi:hypothetical protein